MSKRSAEEALREEGDIYDDDDGMHEDDEDTQNLASYEHEEKDDIDLELEESSSSQRGDASTSNPYLANAGSLFPDSLLSQSQSQPTAAETDFDGNEDAERTTIDDGDEYVVSNVEDPDETVGMIGDDYDYDEPSVLAAVYEAPRVVGQSLCFTVTLATAPLLAYKYTSHTHTLHILHLFLTVSVALFAGHPRAEKTPILLDPVR